MAGLPLFLALLLGLIFLILIRRLPREEGKEGLLGRFVRIADVRGSRAGGGSRSFAAQHAVGHECDSCSL